MAVIRNLMTASVLAVLVCISASPAKADSGFGIGGGLSMYFPAMDIEDLPGSVIGLNVLPGAYVRSRYILAMFNLSLNTSYLRVKAGETSKGGLGFGWGADVATLFGKEWGFHFNPRFRQTSLNTDAGNFKFTEFFTTLGVGYRSKHVIFSASLFRVGARPNASSMLAFMIDSNVAYLF